MRNVLIILFLYPTLCQSQSLLQPGFDGREYIQLLSLAFHGNSIPDSAERLHAKDPYRMMYRSAEMGLANRWTLYLRGDSVAVIDLRGTVNQSASWLENFYSAMIPATGSLQVNDSTIFKYQLARDARAMVHAGWMIGLSYLGPDIERKINQFFKDKKVTQFLIFGHSQGGALATLLRSWLEYEKENGRIPAVQFKTYCSAAPKVGNLYYTYDFDFITRGGWQFTVVNALDWVPETPFSIQTLDDYTPPNPLSNAKVVIKKQKFLSRVALGIVFNKLDRKSRKAQKKFQKYLGKKIYVQIRKILPQFKEPVYATGSNYMRAGIPIILMPDEEYNKAFPSTPDSFFIHHLFAPYYWLVRKWYL
jgi:hypothetical protein